MRGGFIISNLHFHVNKRYEEVTAGVIKYVVVSVLLIICPPHFDVMMRVHAVGMGPYKPRTGLTVQCMNMHRPYWPHRPYTVYMAVLYTKQGAVKLSPNVKALATNTGRCTCSPLATNTGRQFLLI